MPAAMTNERQQGLRLERAYVGGRTYGSVVRIVSISRGRAARRPGRLSKPMAFVMRLSSPTRSRGTPLIEQERRESTDTDIIATDIPANDAEEDRQHERQHP
jgi:hypothetical protein